MDWLRSVHFYRKVPADLTEATVTGGAISLISTIVMVYLFCSNFLAYLAVDMTTSIVLDSSDEKKLQLNFNVTLYHLPCRFATLDIVDVMGTHFQNVTLAQNVNPNPTPGPSHESAAEESARPLLRRRA